MNWGGALLILLALGLFVAEGFTGHGILAAGGLVSLVLGILIWIGAGPLSGASPWLIAIIVLLVGGFVFFAVQRVVKAHRMRIAAGREDLLGRTGVAKTALNPEGMVLVYGELWTAVSEGGPVESGAEVTVKRVEGLKLYVARK